MTKVRLLWLPAQNYRFEEDGNTLIFVWVAGGPLDTYRVDEQQK